MRPPTPGGGASVLPLPPGDPGGVWRAAALLRSAAGGLDATQLLPYRGHQPGLDASWAGAAADEARSESEVVAGRAAYLLGRLVRAAAVLEELGDTLDAAQRAVVGLQSSYDAAAPPDPTLPLPLEIGAIAGRYAVALAELDLAGDVAAHQLWSLCGEVGDGPVGSGGRRSGAAWGAARFEPDPRAAVLSGLPVVTGRIHQIEAERAAGDVVAGLDRVAVGDAVGVDEMAALLQSRAPDPVFAQALWARLPPDRVAVCLATMAGLGGGSMSSVQRGWSRGRGVDVMQGLGVALTSAANPAYATGLDVASAARLATWRGPWLARLADSSVRAVRIDDETTVGRGWVHGQLLAGLRGTGLSPGLPYAATVGVALVAADRRARRSDGVMAMLNPTVNGRPWVVPGVVEDPVVAVAEALRGDAAAARAWLLHPLPGDPGQLVVDHLVRGRYLWTNARDASVSMAAVGRLVVAAGSDPGERDAVSVSAAFVAAVGVESVGTPDGGAFRLALTPALGSLGAVLARYPDAVTGALDESTGPGLDAASLTPAERLVRHGREASTWDPVIADRATATALVGELAFDGVARSTAGRDPRAAPALAQVMTSIGDRLEADLVAAVTADHAGDTHAVEAAARRLGSTVGFTLTAAGAALAGRDADADATNRAVAGVADLAVGKLAIPGAAGKVATPVVRAAAEHLVAAALPTDAEAGRRQATTAAVEKARDDALVAARSLVSRARPWSADQAPQQWAARGATTRDPERFWDDSGRPLPEDAMTTAQRRSFGDWRRDEHLSVYDTVPQAVRDAIDVGVRDVTPPPLAAG